MSGTVMKFGPQWIRTLTDGAAPSTANNLNPITNSNNNNNNNITSSSINNSSSSSATNHIAGNPSSFSSNNNSNNGSAAGKYKLAEYRYGREEMLALYEQEMESPEDIKKFTDLFVEKARMPMAMTQMSEEELKLSTRNWNSEAVLRSSGKIAASVAAAAGGMGSGGGGPGPNSTSGGVPGGAIGGMVASTLNDRDTRQLSERGAPGALTAAGVLSSSPRGPPGSLSRIPLEQRGLLSSLNSRGPSTIRNLVGRGPNLYIRSQSHDDEGVDDGGTTSGGGSAGFDSRFGLQGQPRQPSSLRARFETNRTASGGAPNSKPIDIKSGSTLDGEISNERRSVFDRLPNKYTVDDKIVRKDVNGRPIQSSDWRSREWSGSGVDNRASKAPAEERSWRSARASGATEDWRSNNSANTSSSSWYVRTDDQRNLRAGAPQNQENLISGSNGKRDALRQPSADERYGDEDDDCANAAAAVAQQRHRRDSLPEWSIGDPLSGDKVGSFDATGAFREIAREDGSDLMSKGKNRQEQSGYEIKSTGGASEQEWRLKTTNNSSNTYNIQDSRNLNGVNTSTSLSELEKLSLLDRNVIPSRKEAEAAGASNESRTKKSEGRRDQQSREIQDRFSDGNFQNCIHNQLSGNKVDVQTRTSPQTSDTEHKKTIDNSRNSVSPQSCQRSVNQSLPANIQQMLKKQQQTNQNQQQSFLSAIAGSSNAMQQPSNNDEDGFAHLERAAEIMVAEWTAEEEHEISAPPSAYFGNKINLTREQHDAQANLLQNNTDARLSNQAQQQQKQQQQQQSAPEQAPANAPTAFDSNNQKKFILLPFNHEDSQQWFYRDTQGVIQGPFSATEMFEWYKAGYFVKELLVRRACDELFYPLGEVIKIWDRIPFAPISMNVPPPPPITTQALLQFRAVTKQLEIAASMNPSQGQIPPNTFGITHPGTVLLHGPIIQQQQQQVHQVLAAASLNQNISGPQEQQAGIRQILEATRQHDQSMVQQQRAHPGNVIDQNEMQTQLRQLLAQLKNREGFSNLNAQEQQEVLVRQFVASRAIPGGLQDQEQTLLQQRARMMPFLPFFSSDQERFRYQQRLELERRQKEEAEKQGRFMMEQRMKAEEEKQRIMDELQNRQRKQKEENEKHRQEAEKDRLLKLSQLKQQQLAKQQEEFRQQMQNQQRLQQQQQQEKKQQQQIVQLNSIQQQQQQQVVQLNSIQQQQQQQIERAKKAAQAQQVQQEQQRKTAWSTVSKPDQEPVSLATLQKMQEEKEKERERQRLMQQQIQSNQQQQQQLQQQLQRQMTWANAAQQSKPAPIKTLAEIQKEEEERLAREKQKKTKVQPTVPYAGVWNNAASHLSWKNPPPADS